VRVSSESHSGTQPEAIAAHALFQSPNHHGAWILAVCQ
jgi:hypothetical protein